MDLKSTIAWSQTALLHSVSCTNEALAKSNLILPFFKHLGYDPSDPRVVVLEPRVELGKRYPDHADIVLYVRGNPAIVIECKAPGKVLLRHFDQLSRYYNVCDDALIGILTDGVHYQFFTDVDKDGALDDEPFLTFSLEKLAGRGFTTQEAEFFTKIHRDEFDELWVAQFAEAESLRRLLTRWLSEQLKEPSSQFCRYVLGQLDIKHIRESRIGAYRGLLQEAFAHSLANEIYEKIKRRKPQPPAPSRTTIGSSRVITTERELRIFAHCKSRLTALLNRKNDLGEVDEIQYRDSIKKFSVFYRKRRKGKLFDYIDEGDRDKFIFYLNDGEQVIYDAANIDKPLLATFRQRLLEAQYW